MGSSHSRELLPSQLGAHRRGLAVGLLTVAFAFAGTGAAHAVTDPAGDAADKIDLTEFKAATSGRGVGLSIRFAGRAPGANDRVKVCFETGAGAVCLAKADQTVTYKKRHLDAHVTRGKRSLRIWLRSAHLGLEPGKTLNVRPRVSLLASGCQTGCRDTTAALDLTYTPPTSCDSRSRRYTNGPRGRKLVALTFDDGPHPATRLVLNYLRAYRVPATFYMIGNQVGAHHDFIRRMINEGHEVADHSYRHEAYPSSSSIARTAKLIGAASGFRPCTFRPPYGAVNTALVNRAGALGMATVVWDVDPSDYATNDSAAIARRASVGTSGSIVLLHDGGGGNYATAQAVPKIIRNYRSRGFKFVTVDELLGFQPR